MGMGLPKVSFPAYSLLRHDVVFPPVYAKCERRIIHLFIYLKRFQHNGGGAAAEGLKLDEARWPLASVQAKQPEQTLTR